MELRLTYILVVQCPLKVMVETEMGCPDYIRSCMEDCWAEQPEQRPDFPTIRDRLRKMREGMWVDWTFPLYDLMTTCSDLFYHLSFHFLFLSSFDTQEAVHHGSNDGHDGDLRQQPRSPSQRAYTVALWRETENGRPPPSNAAKVSCYRSNRQR